jgi:hypothetical protein
MEERKIRKCVIPAQARIQHRNSDSQLLGNDGTPKFHVEDSAHAFRPDLYRVCAGNVTVRYSFVVADVASKPALTPVIQRYGCAFYTRTRACPGFEMCSSVLS